MPRELFSIERNIMFVNFDLVKEKMKNARVDKPISGTLSGHSAGEPFDKHVYRLIKEQLPNNTYRQFEYLNELFKSNPGCITFSSRMSLIKSNSVSFLLSRGKQATTNWSIQEQFVEKQNDTADILVTDNDNFQIIDIKTRNLGLSPQPPNIISAYKLAQLMALLIKHNEFSKVSIVYFAIEWDLDKEYLVCKNSFYADLFKEDPKTLYINWAAAMQIQFHVPNLKQNYTAPKEQWAREYLLHFTQQAKKRADDMDRKFIKPFEIYL